MFGCMFCACLDQQLSIDVFEGWYPSTQKKSSSSEKVKRPHFSLGKLLLKVPDIVITQTLA